MRSDLEDDLGSTLDERCGRQQLDDRPEFADHHGDNCIELGIGGTEFRAGD
jgi:hypothetical protein